MTEGELQLRHDRLRKAMAEQGIDVLVAFAPGWRRENVRYLTDAAVTGSLVLALLPANGEPSAYSTRRADLAAIAGRGWVTEVQHVAFPDVTAFVERLRDLRPGRVGT